MNQNNITTWYNKKTFQQFSLALVAFVICQIVLAVVLHYFGTDYFYAKNWARNDSDHYLKIATTGYELMPCAGLEGYALDSKEFCGNTAWFPGYPFLIYLVASIFGNHLIVAGIISKIFYVLSLVFALKIMGVEKFNFRNLLLVLIPAFCFGFIYYNAIFPMSTLLFCVLVGIYFFLKDKPWHAGLFFFLASFVYSTGFLLAVVFATYILFKNYKNFKVVITKSFFPLLMGFLGVMSVFALHQIMLGDWQAFSKVQAKYGHGFQSPIKNMGIFFKKPDFQNFDITHFIHYQTFLVLAGFVLLTYFYIKNKMYQNTLYFLTYIYLFWYLFFPWLVGGDLSMYRAESMLLPFVFLLKETRTSTLVIVLSFLLFIGIPMSYLFFTKVLI